MHAKLVSFVCAPLLAVALGACTHTSPTPGEGEAATPVAPVESPATDGRVHRSGVLSYKELPHTMTFEDYDGVEFWIDGQPVEPSETVPRDGLVLLNGKRVAAECVMRVPGKPNLYEQYPVGPDGGPLPRSPRCTIKAVALASE